MKEKVKTKLFGWYSDGIDIQFISELLVLATLNRYSTILLPHNLTCKPVPSFFASSHSTKLPEGWGEIGGWRTFRNGHDQGHQKLLQKINRIVGPNALLGWTEHVLSAQ